MLNNGFEIRIGFSFHCLSSALSFSLYSFILDFSSTFFLLMLFCSIGYISAVSNAIFRIYGLISSILSASLTLLLARSLECFCWILVWMREHSNSSEIEYVRSLVSWNCFLSQTKRNVENVWVCECIFWYIQTLTIYVSALHKKTVFSHG